MTQVCAHCQALARELEEARLALGWTRSLDREQALRERLGISPQQAAILSALYAARGRVVSSGVLSDIVNGHRSGEADFDNVLKVAVHRLRRAIGVNAIETFRASGYRLNDLGRLQCEEAFEGYDRARKAAA